MVTIATSSKVPWGTLGPDGAKTWRLHAGQSDIMRSTARFKAAIAGTGGGKTAMGPLWVIDQIRRLQANRSFNDESILGLIVAPTYQIMARATAPTLVKMLEGTDLEGIYVESRSRYYLPHGMGVIWTLSADNPGGLEGGQFDFAWVDEGGQIKYDAWVAIQGRVGQKEAPVLITTTPYGLNWLYTHFYKPYLAGDRTYYVRQWASNANPAYSTAEYERAKRSMSPQRAAMRYDGQFMKMAGLVYPTFDDCRVKHFDPPPGRMVGGLDWGWNSPFAAVAGVVYIDEYGDEILYIHYERYKRATPLGVHARAMPKGHMWFADPAEPDSIYEMRKAGHRVRPGVNRILPGIDAVSSRLYTRRLLISDRCRALLGEANLYAYPAKDDEPYGDKPIDDNNHALDALRYLVMGIDKRRIHTSSDDNGQEETTTATTATTATTDTTDTTDTGSASDRIKRGVGAVGAGRN